MTPVRLLPRGARLRRDPTPGSSHTRTALLPGSSRQQWAAVESATDHICAAATPPEAQPEETTAKP